jgi:hypothetical protein
MTIPPTRAEQRRFTRIPFQTSVTLTRDGHSWQGELLDISLNGALVRLPPDWVGRVGDACALELRPAAADVVIAMSTIVAHREDGQVGLRCVHIDVDSISHLRRLVELNLGDARQLQRELHALGASDD